jgi:NAD+ kinase
LNIHTFLRDDEKTRELNEKFKALFQYYHFTNHLNEEPDVVLSIGGDGTFLDAVRTYGLDPIYIGINTGSLGFYADWVCEDAEKIIHLLKTETYFLAKQNVLDFQIQFENGEMVESFALNELSFRNQTYESIGCEVWISDLLFEAYRGDGLIISTPSGSTAFSKSLGSSIIDLEFEAIQLTEIAGVNNRVHRTIQNGIIIPKTRRLCLKLKTKNIQLAFDNIQKRYENVEIISCIAGNKPLKTITKEKDFYWNRVKKSFLN